MIAVRCQLFKGYRLRLISHALHSQNYLPYAQALTVPVPNFLSYAEPFGALRAWRLDLVCKKYLRLPIVPSFSFCKVGSDSTVPSRRCPRDEARYVTKRDKSVTRCFLDVLPGERRARIRLFRCDRPYLRDEDPPRSFWRGWPFALRYYGKNLTIRSHWR